MKFLSRLPLIVFLTAVFIIVGFYLANALDLGIIDVKHVTAKGLFLGTGLTKTYSEPISSWTFHNWSFQAGYSLDIFGIEANLIPISLKFGTPTDFGYGVQVRYFVPTKK